MVIDEVILYIFLLCLANMFLSVMTLLVTLIMAVRRRHAKKKEEQPPPEKKEKLPEKKPSPNKGTMIPQY